MHKYGISILRRWARRTWMATQPQAVILLYHRITDLNSDPQLLSITPEHFTEHLEHLREYYYPMNLNKLAEAIKGKQVPNHTFVITFDDGYVDNLWNAKPILEKYKIPATIFITSKYVGQNQEFWWDELERLLFFPESLPESLTLTINNKLYSWKIENQIENNNFNSENYCHWNVTLSDTPTLRHRAYRDLCNLLRPMDYSAREKILNDLSSWAGLEETYRQDYRAMSADEICSLTKDGLIDVGSHTHTHPVLASLSLQDQIKEIKESKSYLEAILDRPINYFSYPYGSKSDYTAKTITIVKNSGFSCACSNFTGVIRQGTDCFQLPRFIVRDWDGDEFARRLKEWFHG